MFHAVYIECCYVVQIKIEKKKTRRRGGGPLLIDVTFCLGQTLRPISSQRSNCFNKFLMPVRVAVSERVQPSSFSSSSSSSTYSHICEPIRMESTHSVCVYRLAFFNRFFYIRLRVLDVRSPSYMYSYVYLRYQLLSSPSPSSSSSFYRIT